MYSIYKVPKVKCTDDEVELLLKVTCDYKVLKAADGTDWESIQSKYAGVNGGRISRGNGCKKDLNKDYPYKKTEKQVLMMKLKATRTSLGKQEEAW